MYMHSCKTVLFGTAGDRVLVQGCFSDDVNEPMLVYPADLHVNVTAETCIETCESLKYKYASIQLEQVLRKIRTSSS